VHAVVARSTLPSQNVEITPAPDHFWKLRCRNSVCRCAPKHVSKSKCTKHTTYRALLEVEMSIKSARRCGAKHIWKSNVRNTPFSDHFWKLRCQKSILKKVHTVVARSTFPSQTSSGPLLQVDMSKKCTPLWHEAHFEVKM